MQVSGAVIASPLRTSRSAIIVVALSLALLVSSAFVSVSTVRAAAAPLKFVLIVGPAGSQLSADLADAESLAVQAEAYGMDVRRVYFPHATWDNVMANIQGANLVYYAAHGYGWPSPYTKVITEARQDGVGLNTFDGSSNTQYTYYGANVIKQYWQLAPNAIVFLNHDCYTSGNGEPGMAIPTLDVARQRVDNFANGFLAVGATAVFAFEWQRFNKALTMLMTTDSTMEQIFQTPGAKPTGMWGWVGWDPHKFDSVRTPGAKNYLDPDQPNGFLRSVTGDLTMTAAQWAQGTGGSAPPVLSNLAALAAGFVPFSQTQTPTFTPNGDGVTDSVDLTFTVDREAFVDMVVTNGAGGVVRNLSGWSPGGSGKSTWDGKKNDGAVVGDGDYTVTATPRNRAGTTGAPQSVDLKVLTAMRAPAVTPTVFYAADGDNLAPTTKFSVTLDREATFWWKVVDGNGNVVRTYINGVTTNPGSMNWTWDGRDGNGVYVPDGTYYSVMTATTAAGTYSHSMAVDARAFRVTPAVPAPFVRGTKVKFFVASAEALMPTTKPKLKVSLPGVLAKTYSTYNVATGGYYATVTFPTTAQAGTFHVLAMGTDSAGLKQQTDYVFQLQ